MGLAAGVKNSAHLAIGAKKPGAVIPAESHSCTLPVFI
jgi:hypothetical protein